MQISSQTQTHLRRVFIAALAVMLVSVPAFGDRKGRFYNDDPIPVEPETQNASGVNAWKIDLFYDLMLNLFGQTAGRTLAKNINKSTRCRIELFTNRILTRGGALKRLFVARSRRDLRWVNLKSACTEGAAGIHHSRRAEKLSGLDPKSNPEGSTASM